MKPLSAKQRKFCEEYVRNGCDATLAAEASGYARSAAYVILERQDAAAYIRELSEVAKEAIKTDIAESAKKSSKNSAIATAQELQQFWTKTMMADASLNPPPSFNERLKASELLGKSLGMFIERRQLSGDPENKTAIKVVFT